MRKTNLVMIVIAGWLVASCSENFLDVSPETNLTSATFYQTEDDFVQGINASYVYLRDIYDDMYIMEEMRSDNTHYVYYSNDRGNQNVERERVADFTSQSTNGYTNGIYYDSYEGISKVNAILDRIDNIDDPEFDDTVQDRIKGEALFLRALYYFGLVRNYGSVPMHLTEVTSRDGSTQPPASAEEIYAQIISDATEAESLLLPQSETQNGRATTGAANTLLGHVYLTIGEYGNAEDALSQVTGYALLDDYADIFDPDNKYNEEIIFAVQYMSGPQGHESNWAYEFLPRMESTEPITGVSGNNLFTGGWNIPNWDLIDLYSDGDEREDATVAYFVDPENSQHDIARNDSIPYVKKYLHPPYASHNNTDENWPVYRYADVLLMLAEAINEQGGRLTEAQEYLNQVRRRAELNDYSAAGQEDLRQAIATERRRELAFENKRWHDLVRTGNAVQTMNNYGAELKQTHSYLQASTYNVEENDLLYPIPEGEVEMNPDLNQNPGYN